ncbi:MAG: LacI family DNA-binding transcriptional regulator [Anaerolineae bacterium]|nr:LacI family DNA-binding transcriptional regulator [Anaerolineae bacterium]
MAHSTVYDVAHKAGVSIATVSRVVNSPEKVNLETRTKVLQAIDQLGYVPKAEAAARARKSAGRIAVLAPFFTYPSFVQRLRGVANALAHLPYEMTVYNVDNTARRDSYVTSLSLTRRFDGLILMALPFTQVTVERLVNNSIETVSIEVTHPSFSSIEIDDHAGGRLAADFLIRKGHKRLGFIGDTDLPDLAFPTSDRRLTGYRAAVRDAGLELDPLNISLAAQSLQNGRHSMHALMSQPHPPTAVFCASDTQAMGALKAAHELYLNVPRDVAIVGFDDLDFADYIGLTTIRQHLEESGRLAVELLLSRLENRARPIKNVRLTLEVIERETT